MFTLHIKPIYSLVIGDILTYGCEAHDLIYNNLRMIYNNGSFTYQRTHYDHEWHLVEKNQLENINIEWNSTRK